MRAWVGPFHWTIAIDILGLFLPSSFMLLGKKEKEWSKTSELFTRRDPLSQLISSLAVRRLFVDFFALVTGLFPAVLRLFKHKNNDEQYALQLKWENENASSTKTIEFVEALIWAVASTKPGMDWKWLGIERELICIPSPWQQPKDHNYARQLRWDSYGRSVPARGRSLARPWALRSYGSYESWATT